MKIKGSHLKIIFSCLLAIVLYCASFSNSWANTGQRKNVLILNSYHNGLIWSDKETEGIRQVLNKFDVPIDVYVEYLDWKHRPESRNMDLTYQLLSYKYANSNLDLVFAVDDAALNVALSYRDNLWPGTPIIFCGVNESVSKLQISRAQNVTGIYEIKDAKGSLEAALYINPNIKKVFVIHDSTESGLASRRVVEKAEKDFKNRLIFEYSGDMTTESILDKISNLDTNSIVLLTTYYRGKNGKVFDSDQIAKLISETSAVPVYHIQEPSLGHGIVGGSLLSGTLQGQRAAEMGLAILKGKSVSEIPTVSKNVSRLVFDYNQLKRFGISISKLPPQSEIINKPPSLWKEYREFIVTIIMIITLMVIFIIGLLFNIRRRKQAELKLKSNNVELRSLYEQIAAADEQLRGQYDQLLETQDLNYRLAYYDTLTGLPNRITLVEKVTEALQKTQNGDKYALLFIDLDNFKFINDSFGHSLGDKILVEVGSRTQAYTKDGIVARLGGDEFVIILEYHQRESLEEYLNGLTNLMWKPFEVEGHTFHITCSVGIALIPKDGFNTDELLKNADTAMYQAKNNGKKSYVFFDQAMNKAVVEKMKLENDLRRAIEKKEFVLYYQPQIHLKTGQIIGFEALLRWDNPELGIIGPDQFIGTAEETGLIVPIGRWVLQEACSFNRRLKEMGHDLFVSVNISVPELIQGNFVENVLAIVKGNGLVPEHLVLEITETVLMQSVQDGKNKLKQLREKGIQSSLDDFGKGYSSLTYLEQLPITILKIDKSFINDISKHLQKREITALIIDLAHQLDLQVVAEGVENISQLKYLTDHNCDMIQGYFLSKPLSEEKFIELVEHYQKGLCL